jgi:hypothetical protein
MPIYLIGAAIVLRSWCRRRTALRDVTNDDPRLGAVAARRDESIEIVAGGGTALLNVRPDSSQLKETDPTRFAAER